MRGDGLDGSALTATGGSVEVLCPSLQINLSHRHLLVTIVSMTDHLLSLCGRNHERSVCLFAMCADILARGEDSAQVWSQSTSILNIYRRCPSPYKLLVSLPVV